MHRFIMSLLPTGPQDPLYPSLLSYLLLCSPLLTHHPQPQESLNINEDDQAVATTFNAALVKPYLCTVPLSLLQELGTAYCNGELREEVFAEAVLRAGLPHLVENLSPLLLPPAVQRKASTVAKPRDTTLEDLSHTKAIAELSKIAQSLHIEGDGHDMNAKTANNEVDEGGEEEEEEDCPRLRKVAARDAVRRLGLGYHHVLSHLLPSLARDSDSPPPPESSGFALYVQLHRYLFSNAPAAMSLQCSDYFQRLIAHVRISFEPALQHVVAASYSHRFFTLSALLVSPP